MMSRLYGVWVVIAVVVFSPLKAEQNSKHPIYEQQLSDGSTLYTDQPERADNAASANAPKKKVGLGVLGFVSGAGNAPGTVIVPGEKADAVEQPERPPLDVASTSYTTLRIESPANSSAVWAEQPGVKIVVDIQPLINPEHSLQVRVDPKAWQSVDHDNGVTELPLERGSHRIQARIVDATGGLVRLSAPVKFTVHRASALQ